MIQWHIHCLNRNGESDEEILWDKLVKKSVKGELRRKMNLWSNKTLAPINRSLRFVFMIIECKELYL